MAELVQTPLGRHHSKIIERLEQSLEDAHELDALSTARITLFPILQACNIDIFNLKILRRKAPLLQTKVRYKLKLANSYITVDVWSAGENLSSELHTIDLPQGSIFGIRTDGSEWHIIDFRPAHPSVHIASLFSPSFPKLAARLFARSHNLSLEDRLNTALNLLSQTPDEAVRTSHIGLKDVEGHASRSEHFIGNLEVMFDGEIVPIFSRSSYYLVLAALAVQSGKESYIPPKDLVRKSHVSEEETSLYSLGKANIYLHLQENDPSREVAIQLLLRKLKLEHRFVARHLNRPYP